MSADRTVSASLAQMWVMFAVTKGLDSDEICAASGFRAAALADRDRQVPWTWYSALRRTVIDRLPNVAVGVELASFASVATLGYLGLALERCANSLEVLQLVVRYATTIDSATPELLPRVIFEADSVHWIIPRMKDDPPEATEAIVIGCATLLPRLADFSFRPRRVTFVDHREELGELLRSVLRCPVEFGAKEARIVFDRADLERPLRGADRDGVKQCEAELNKVMARLDTPFVTVALRAIEALLPSGNVTPALVARRLGVSTRSLQRRLRAHGVTYQGIVDGARRDIAIRAISDARLSLDDIAAAVGYEDASSLNRAFKRWTGTSPRAYRRRAGAALDPAKGPARPDTARKRP